MTDPARSTILLVDDTPTNLELLLGYFTEKNFEVLIAVDGPTAIERARLTRPDLILLDVMMPGMDGFETCRRLRQTTETAEIPVLFMTALAETESKVRAFEAGGVDYIAKPFQAEEVLARINTHLRLRALQKELARANVELEAEVAQRTAELQQSNANLTAAVQEIERLKDLVDAENEYLRKEGGAPTQTEGIVTQAKVMQQLLFRLEQVAATDATVLILGETGTGKELLATAVHQHSQRRNNPLVKVNCAALPATLIESELFGHEKGAFTDAVSAKKGRFELADQGSLFLDEIGDLPLSLQAKLLRVIQEGEFQRLGSERTKRVDVRVIAATNRDLLASVQKGEFREDLYYRLNVIPLENPPLRERREDIPLLVDHFLEKHAHRVGRLIKSVPAAVIQKLQRYDWPGNVRELENVVARAMIMTQGTILQLDDWPPARSRGNKRRLSQGPIADSYLTATEMRELEKQNIAAALTVAGGRISGNGGAAALLGIKASTLQSRIKALGVPRADSK